MTTSAQPPLLQHLQALHHDAAGVQEASVAKHGARLGALLQLDLCEEGV